MPNKNMLMELFNCMIARQLCWYHLKQCSSNSVAEIFAQSDDTITGKHLLRPLKFYISTSFHTYLPFPPALHPHSPQGSPSNTFTRWEVPDPTTIETELVYQLQPSIITSINHCHLAPRQPHASLSAAPSACSPQECRVMRDGKGHPGIQLLAMFVRKERCVVRVCKLVYIYIWGI